MNKTVSCTLTHDGYKVKDRNNPAGADLRVSDNFSMSGMSHIMIKCDDPTIKFRISGEKLIIRTDADVKFRIRENHLGSTDCDAFDGRYFKNGDSVIPTDYDRLYISDPCKNKADRETATGNFNVWFE